MKTLKSNEQLRKRLADFRGKSDELIVCGMETRIAIFFAQNNLPFLLADRLIPLIKCLSPNDKYVAQLAMARQKTGNVIRSGN